MMNNYNIIGEFVLMEFFFLNSKQKLKSFILIIIIIEHIAYRHRHFVLYGHNQQLAQ